MNDKWKTKAVPINQSFIFFDQDCKESKTMRKKLDIAKMKHINFNF